LPWDRTFSVISAVTVAEEGVASGKRYYLLQQSLWLARHATGDPGIGTPAIAALVYQIGIVAGMAAIALRCVIHHSSSARKIADGIALLSIVLFALASPVQSWYMLLLAMLPLVSRRMLLPISLVGGAEFFYLTWWLHGSPAWPIATDYDLRAMAMAILRISAARR